MTDYGIYLKGLLREKKDKETNKTKEVEKHYFVVLGDGDDIPKIGSCETEVGAFKANVCDKVSFKAKIKEWDGKPYISYSELKLAK